MTIDDFTAYLTGMSPLKICYDDDKVIYYGEVWNMPLKFREFEIDSVDAENDALVIYIMRGE